MRRIAVCAAVLAMLLPPAFAEGQVTLNLTGGPNFATWVWPERAGRQKPWSWLGAALGVSARLPVDEKWGIQLGVGVSEKGWSDEGICWVGWESFACSAKVGKWITYFESTVLADRQFRLGDRFRLHLLAGSALGYQWYDDPRKAARFDFGVIAGSHVETRLFGGLGLLVGALYNHGIKNVHSGYVVEEAKSWYYAKSRTLNLSTGLSYLIG